MILPALLLLNLLRLFEVFCVSIQILKTIISVKNAIGILIEVRLNLYDAFDSMNSLTILILSIHECGISFHLFVFSSAALLYSNNELSEREIRKIISITIVSNNKIPRKEINQGGERSLY